MRKMEYTGGVGRDIEMSGNDINKIPYVKFSKQNYKLKNISKMEQ